MKEYKIAKGWAILIYLAAPIMIGLFSWLLVLPFIEDNFSLIWLWLLIPLSLGMISLMLVGLLDTIRGKIVIDREKIYSITTLSKKQLYFYEIKGYRTNEQYLFIEAFSENKKRIKISTYIEKSDEIIYWLTYNYPNLDLIEKQEEQESFLENNKYGLTAEERESKLNKAKKVAKILNWLATIIAAWTLFYPKPYDYAVIASISFPIIALIIYKLSNGLIRLDDKKASNFPSITWAIVVTSAAIMLRALLDYNIFDYSGIWLPTLIATATIITIMLWQNNEFQLKKTMDIIVVISVTVLFFGYSYGSIVTLNCNFDYSESKLYKAVVLNKKISSGDKKTYYLELTTWGTQTENEDVSVSVNLYNKLNKNDEVNIYFKKGVFDIPWFIVTEP